MTVMERTSLPLYVAARGLLDGVALFNALCSLLTLFILYRLAFAKSRTIKPTPYVWLIVIMTICQMFYDFTILLLLECSAQKAFSPTQVTQCVSFTYFISVFFGTASAGWSNVLSLVVCYIIAMRKKVNFTRVLPIAAFFIFGLGFVIGTIEAYYYAISPSNPHFVSTFHGYNTIRILQVVISITAVAAILLNFYWSKNNKSTSSVKTSETAFNAMVVLAKRLLLYPLVMACARIPVSFYQYKYNESIARYDPRTFTAGQTTAVFFYILFVPIAGFGNLVVFLIVQNGAYDILMSDLYACVGKKYVTQREIKEEMFRNSSIQNASSKSSKYSRHEQDRDSELHGSKESHTSTSSDDKDPPATTTTTPASVDTKIKRATILSPPTTQQANTTSFQQQSFLDKRDEEELVDEIVGSSSPSTEKIDDDHIPNPLALAALEVGAAGEGKKNSDLTEVRRL